MFVSTYAYSISPDKVPNIIKANFVSEYPDAEVIRWESTDYLDYKVEFKVGDGYGAAFYDSAVKFIEDDRTIEWRQVPLTGRMEIYHLGENRIMNVLKITTAKKKSITRLILRIILKYNKSLWTKREICFVNFKTSPNITSLIKHIKEMILFIKTY